MATYTKKGARNTDDLICQQHTGLRTNIYIPLDIIVGTEGNDVLRGINGQKNRVNGLGGDDQIYGGDIADILNGGGGSDVLFGNAGNDTLKGGAGNDFIRGEEGDDTLRGGKSDDELVGGTGDDIFVFAEGDDADEIVNEYNTDDMDTVKFTDVAATEITKVSRHLENMTLHYGTSDQLTIKSYFYFNGINIDQLQFSEGVVWTFADIKPKAIQGTADAHPCVLDVGNPCRHDGSIC